MANTIVTGNTTGASPAMRRNSIPVFPGATIAAALCFFGWRKRRSLQWILLHIVSVAGINLFAGCGSAGEFQLPR